MNRESTGVCVLGSPRSGTSLTTHVLSLLGVYVGEQDELKPPGPGNLGGFWEHREMMELNRRLLNAVGGSMVEPPDAWPTGEAAELLADEREEARRLLDETFGGRALWGWKDPQMCFTLPFWQSLLPEMLYVICVRNPREVARSAAEFSGIEFDQAIALWPQYMAAALANTSGAPRVVVPYDEYFSDPGKVVARLARFIGRTLPLPDDVGRRIRSTVDDRHRHHEEDLADFAADRGIPDRVVSLYLAMRTFAAVETDPGLSSGLDAYAKRIRESGAPAYSADR